MIRNIITIDESKCNGCGLCITACHEGAIELIDGKAKLVDEAYCDGLGDCLPQCPTGAIKIEKRKAKPFDEEAVKERMKQMNLTANKSQTEEKVHFGCPGSMSRMIQNTASNVKNTHANADNEVKQAGSSDIKSELRQWPVQLELVSPMADYFNGANLLVAADCTAYAYANFHKDFIKDHITVIGCPKLDDTAYYTEKLTEILERNNIKSITVVRMVVPCCGGIVSAVKNAMLKSGKIVPYNEVTIGIEGEII